MNATAVASPGQMFSSFGQPTQSSSKPVANPFATTTPATTTANPFGFGSASSNSTSNTAKRDNPFADSGPAQKTSAFGGFGAPSNDGSAAAKQPIFGSNDKPTLQNNGANPFGAPSKPPSTGFGGFSKPPSAFPSSIASVIQDAGTDNSSPFKYDQNDPHAVKVYTQLRKDGLAPPAWPSQPGNPTNKAQMAKFREQYEEYRSKVRASLTRAGLIDDPTKRKALTEAIEFRGICQDMCPEYEKIQRITEHDIPQPERDPATTFADKKRMVKKLARSAAGQEAPLPMDVLSIKTLRKTLNYLIDDLLSVDENLPTLHGYLWDRTRAIRRDFSFFSSLAAEDVKMQANVLEDIARFHVTSLHLLCREGKAPESFVEQQELEQLGKALLSLRDIYDDCNAQDIVCENEAEFRAYFLIFHANDPNIMDVLQRQWRRSLWTDSEEIQTAVSLVEALQNTQDFHGPLKEGPSLAASGAHQAFFRIVEDRKVSYTMACFAECHFPQLRRSILRNVKRALSRPKESANDVTAETLNRFLRFDTVQEAIDFAELHDLEFGASPTFGDVSQRPLILNNKTPLPHHRLKHQFSQSMVERKRGNRPLPDIIHSSVFESKSSSAPVPAAEESLFVPESSRTASSVKAPTTQPAKSPFSVAPSTTPPAPTTTPAAPFTTTTSSIPPSTTASALFASKAGSATTPSPFPATTPSPFQGFGKPSETTSVTKPEVPATKPSGGLSDKPAASPFAGFSSGIPAPTSSLIASPTATSGGTTTSTTPVKSPFSGFESTTPKAPPKFNIGTPALSQGSSPKTSALGGQQPLPGLSLGSSIDAPKSTPPLSPLSKDDSQPKQGSLLPTAPTPSANSSPFTAATNPFNPAPSTPSTPAAPAAQKLAPPPPPPAPPRDRMKDFAEWFALGDSGLLEDFQTYLVEDMLKKVYVKYQHDTEEKRRKEEEERDRQTADNFRRRTLSVTYFYRWKANAREKRLRFLRRTGRDKLRQFHKRQHSSSHRGGSETPRRVSSQELPSTRLQRQQELIDGLKQSANQQRASGSIRASSVIVPASTAGNAIAESINRHFRLPMSVAATPSRSRSSSFSKGGAKTRALREELLGSSQSRFGRSGSSVASSDRSSPDNASRVSNVSERWRLKAMGIVQLPDGTAIPESLAHSQHGQYGHYSQNQRPSTAGYLRRTPSFSGLSSRRESFGATSGSRFVVPSIEQSIPGVAAFESAVASNKRKRMTNESIMLDSDEGASSHKRVMSDAETLIQELRAMREEMEEGTVWFKEQNDKLHDISRGATPL